MVLWLAKKEFGSCVRITIYLSIRAQTLSSNTLHDSDRYLYFLLDIDRFPSCYTMLFLLCLSLTLLYFYLVEDMFLLFLHVFLSHSQIPFICFSDRQVGDKSSQGQQDSCTRSTELHKGDNVCGYWLILAVGRGLLGTIESIVLNAIFTS